MVFSESFRERNILCTEVVFYLYSVFSYCCAKYDELFNITYNVNMSYCVVIDSQPQDMTNIHCVNLNNHPLPYTTKCKYLGQINNNLTDDDDIARQERCFYAQADVLARKCCLCSPSTKITLFQVYCSPMYTVNLVQIRKSHTISLRI